MMTAGEDYPRGVREELAELAGLTEETMPASHESLQHLYDKMTDDAQEFAIVAENARLRFDRAITSRVEQMTRKSWFGTERVVDVDVEYEHPIWFIRQHTDYSGHVMRSRDAKTGNGYHRALAINAKGALVSLAMFDGEFDWRDLNEGAASIEDILRPAVVKTADVDYIYKQWRQNLRDALVYYKTSARSVSPNYSLEPRRRTQR